MGKGKDWKLAENNRRDRMNKEGKIPGFIGALIYMVLGFMKEILFTIVPQKNISLTNDRSGLTRSAMFLFVFIIIHAVGNLHVFLGPDDFNGYGYFYVRLYWTGFGASANIVEEYVLLSAILHVDVRDIYRLEFEIFKSWGWVMFYISAVAIFCTHMCLGWQKVVPAPSLDIPKRYHQKAIHVGYVMTAFVGLIYVSFPIYTHLASMDSGYFGAEVPL